MFVYVNFIYRFAVELTTIIDSSFEAIMSLFAAILFHRSNVPGIMAIVSQKNRNGFQVFYTVCAGHSTSRIAAPGHGPCRHQAVPKTAR